MSNAEDQTVDGWIRPLSMPSIGIVPQIPLNDPVDTVALLRDLCPDAPEQPVTAIKERYQELFSPDLDLLVVPANNRILDKIVWPLKSAKRAYCLADFHGCIATAGYVAEMGVVFLYDLGKDTWEFGRLSRKQKKLLQDRTFERAGQVDRIKILRRLRAIPQQFAEDAYIVSRLRNEYLHSLTKEHTDIRGDARTAYGAAFRLVNQLVGLPLGEAGALTLPTHLARYLRPRPFAH
jgi:hypothetical protein